MPDSPQACFHCGQPVQNKTDFGLKINGLYQPMCCKGCEAVADAIIKGGMGDYYKHRTEKAETVQQDLPDFINQLKAFDLPEIQHSFVREKEGNIREAMLIMEGINCAACIWLNEQYVAALQGVKSFSINHTTRRAQLRWDSNAIQLSDILKAIHDIGYNAHPYDPEHQQQLLEKERRLHIRRLGLAAMLGMQVMILAVALYVGEWRGIEENMRRFFTWLGLGLTLPVLFYSGRPFFESAFRDLKHKRAGMDVPVSLGMLGAFSVSVINTIDGHGPVYYESVCMFVMFLLTARYFEFVARKKALETSEALTYSQPTTATLITETDNETNHETVPAIQLNPGDRVLIRPGEAIPADGIVLGGNSSVDESILTGESRPIRKKNDDELIGGSINIESNLTMRVTHAGKDSLLSHLGELVEQAQAEKPRLVQVADRLASRFVVAVLIFTVAAGFWWWSQGSEDWIAITLSLLVITCPCAFSLATPTAITAAMGNFLSKGLLVTRTTALEKLALANQFVFDKTGTLTTGKMEIVSVEPTTNFDQESALSIAKALETFSEHPISRPFRALKDLPVKVATNVLNQTGSGIEGIIESQRYFIGSIRYIEKTTGLTVDSSMLKEETGTPVVLATEKEIVAVFRLDDKIKEDAATLIETLHTSGNRISLLSGDHIDAVSNVSRQLDISSFTAQMSPQDKLEKVRSIQNKQGSVVMVGDGVNDAPVLAAADVSIAMTGGARLAQASADLIMLTSQLGPIGEAKLLAQRLLKTIRQNLFWAIGYNLTALPAAAMGFVPPWLAALGMSASSLIVVANSIRLSKTGRS